jgi:hypothetical protein
MYVGCRQNNCGVPAACNWHSQQRWLMQGIFSGTSVSFPEFSNGMSQMFMSQTHTMRVLPQQQTMFPSHAGDNFLELTALTVLPCFSNLIEALSQMIS